MLEMTLTLRLLSPLALHRTRSGGQYVESLDYIPGTALRGALAEAYLASHGQSDDVFHTLFLTGQVHFGDLWPSMGDSTTMLCPMTAQACKRYGLSHGQSFRDTLLDVLTPQHNQEKCRETIEDGAEKRQCGESLDRLGGYLWNLDSIKQLTPYSYLRTNTAIDRSTGTIAREMLFTQYTLTGRHKESNEPVFFRGTLRLTNPALRGVLDKWLSPGATLFLGSGRSRGLGEVRVEGWQETMPGIPLAERWHQFNSIAQRVSGDVHSRYFSLTLLSHLALRNELLCPILDNIEPQHLGLPEGIEWVRSPSGHPIRFLDSITIPGWNAALGLPKPDTIALRRGSVLLFRCNASQEQNVLEWLAQIESEGLGERRLEGFGHIAVCYPIHYEQWRTKE